VDPDALEAIVFLESAGRPDAMAGGTEGAVGLTQILAETGQNLLDMRIDVERSARLTRGINRGRRVAARTRERRRIDERYDPAKALAASVRYLQFAAGELDGATTWRSWATTWAWATCRTSWSASTPTRTRPTPRSSSPPAR
jgi:hypothetical protein